MTDHHGKVWWSELVTHEVQTSLDYYRTVCGWRFEKMAAASGTYHLGHRGDTPIIGIMDAADLGPAAPSQATWTTYIAVTDVDLAAEQTTAAGGRILRPPFDVPGIGRVCMLNDPGGAAVGLVAPT